MKPGIFHKTFHVNYTNNLKNSTGTTIRTAASVINPGKEYQFVDNGEPMRGGMKDVYFAKDKSYVVAF